MNRNPFEIMLFIYIFGSIVLGANTESIHANVYLYL